MISEEDIDIGDVFKSYEMDNYEHIHILLDDEPHGNPSIFVDCIKIYLDDLEIISSTFTMGPGHEHTYLGNINNLKIKDVLVVFND